MVVYAGAAVYVGAAAYVGAAIVVYDTGCAVVIGTAVVYVTGAGAGAGAGVGLRARFFGAFFLLMSIATMAPMIAARHRASPMASNHHSQVGHQGDLSCVVVVPVASATAAKSAIANAQNCIGSQWNAENSWPSHCFVINCATLPKSCLS